MGVRLLRRFPARRRQTGPGSAPAVAGCRGHGEGARNLSCRVSTRGTWTPRYIARAREPLGGWVEDDRRRAVLWKTPESNPRCSGLQFSAFPRKEYSYAVRHRWEGKFRRPRALLRRPRFGRPGNPHPWI